MKVEDFLSDDFLKQFKSSQLEQYRLTQLNKQETRKEKALTKEEREEAIQFLEQKDLLQRTNELIGSSGVIGEETNWLLMYLIFTRRKREYPLHVISIYLQTGD